MEPSNTAYRIATRTALVAGIIAIVVCALLLYDYSQRLAKDPLESAAFKTLKAALDQQPTNEALKEQIRALDLRLRREYFRQRAFAHGGAGLLLASVVVFLLAAKTAATLRRRLPQPAAPSTPEDLENQWTPVARWAVAAVCVVLAGTAVMLSFTVRSELYQDREELAAILKPAAEPATEGANGQPAPAPIATEPPTEEEVRRMWPRFRGPDGSGISAYTNVPETWDVKTGKNLLWKTPVPLPGNNSPVVWGKRVFLAGADQRRREVFCFDADSGKLLWQQPVPGTPQSTARLPKVTDDTGYAAPTTATNGRRVFAIFANGDLAAFDINGKPAWAKSLGIPDNSYGHASSLNVHKNLLIVQFDQGSSKAPKSKLLAFDSATGKVAWPVDRPVPNSWASPIVIRQGDREQIITAADPWVIAYNPADGAEIWRVKCLRTDIGPSPVFADGRVFVANDNCELSAIRADGRGDVTATHVLWKGEDGMPDTCSPLATKDYVLLLASYGTLTCYDAAKGDMLWSEDFKDDFTASPGLAGNRLYLVGKVGKTYVVELGPQNCKRLGEANLGEECVTSPAFQDGRIYLRGKNHLFCLGK